MPGDPPLFAAAIIVRNEAQHLRRCLASVRELCEQIVVVDTGSTDDTVAVAESFGATVLYREWDGNFSAARNLGLDAIDAEWILYIDADEEVQRPDLVAVRAALRGADGVVGFMVKFASHVGWTPYWEHRVWRHRPDIRFRGKIHETTVPDLRRIVREEDMRFERIDLFLQHYGYEGDQRAKHERNLPMLLVQVQQSPRRVYLWNHLGRVYDGLGRREEAVAAWEQGLSIVRADGLKEAVDIMVYGSLALHLVHHGKDARALIEEGLALDPEHHTLRLALARNHMERRQWADAIEPLEVLVAAEAGSINRSVLAYSRQLFRELPWPMLGDCWFELGEFDRAADAYTQAAEVGANALEMRSKAAVCRSLASHR